MRFGSRPRRFRRFGQWLGGLLARVRARRRGAAESSDGDSPVEFQASDHPAALDAGADLPTLETPADASAPGGAELQVPDLSAGSSESAGEVAAVPDPREEVRAGLRRRFEAWLDEALAYEPPPAGLDAELLEELTADEAAPPSDGPVGADLYSLWSALTALSGEIKLQGRSFKQLADALGPVQSLVDKTDSALAAHREALDAASSIAADARAIRQDRDEQLRQTAQQSAERQFLDHLLDFRDRMARGLRLARRQLAEVAPDARRSWLGRLLVRPRQVRRLADAVEALAKGCDLSLDRLSDALGRLGISEIDCAGQPLDPQRMCVVDVSEDDSVPRGTVLEVYRPGYQRDGQVVRLAEVKVARASSPAPVRPSDAEPGVIRPATEP